MTALCDVHLHRREVSEPWGFSMVGGREQHKPLTVTKVKRNSPAGGQLEEGEEILKIDETRASDLYHHHAVGLMKNTGLYLKLTVNRSSMSSGPAWKPVEAPVHNFDNPKPKPTVNGSSMTSAPSSVVWKPVQAPAQIFGQHKPKAYYTPVALDLDKPTVPTPYRKPQSQPQPQPQPQLQPLAQQNISVNVPQAYTISHLKPEHPTLPEPPKRRSASPAYEFPALPAESHMGTIPTLPPPRAYSPNPQSSAGYSRVKSRSGGDATGQNLPLTVFYSTPDVAFVGHPSASTRTVDVNLPIGAATIRGVSSVFPHRTPPRIGRPKKSDEGPSIWMRL